MLPPLSAPTPAPVAAPTPAPTPMCLVQALAPKRATTSMVVMNRFGSHSPPLAASSARASEPDVRLTAARERLTLSSPKTPPLGAGDPLTAFSDWGWWVKPLLVPAAPVGH